MEHGDDEVKIHVEVRGALRSYLPSNEYVMDLDMPPGASVGDAVKRLGLPIEMGWNASVRSRLVSDKELLQDGDHVMLFEVIGGG